MGFTRLNCDETVFKLWSVRLVFIVLVVVEVIIVCRLAVEADVVVLVLLFLSMVMVDDDGLVSFLHYHWRLQEERVRRTTWIAAAVNVFGPYTKLVSPQRRQAVNHVRGRITPAFFFFVLV